MKRKKESEEGIDANAWMITFSDLLTLMMTFFVMLLTMATVDPLEVQEAFSLFDSMYAEEGKPESREQETDSYGIFGAGGANPREDTQRGGLVKMPFKYVSARKMSKDAEELESLLINLAQDAGKKFTGFSEEEAKELTNIVVVNKRKGITVYLPDSILFETGDTEINPKFTMILKLMGNWIQKKPYLMKIEGHLDIATTKNKEFFSNWKLSVHRATNIMRYFIENKFIADSKKISAFGYSEFQPLVPDDSFESSKKKRRIEIIFKRPKIS